MERKLERNERGRVGVKKFREETNRSAETEVGVKKKGKEPDRGRRGCRK